MAWTTPRSWVSGEIVTDSQLNLHLRDNLLSLSAHMHTGAAGDGVDLMPALEAENVTRIVHPLAPIGAVNGDSNFFGRFIFTESAATGPIYDATSKWEYLLWTQTFAAACVAYYLGYAGSAPVDLLPRVRAWMAHVTLTTNSHRIGFGSGALNTDPADGVYFRSTNGGNWFAVARAAGVETATDTLIAAATTPQQFEVIVESATVVRYLIAGLVVHTQSGGTIPASGVTLIPGIASVNTASTDTVRWGTALISEHQTKLA